MKKKNLEEKVLFRLIKVVYVVTLLLSVLVLLWAGWDSRPKPKVDDRSHIACDNGEIYLLNKNRFYLFSVEDTFSSSEDVEARKLCEYKVLNDYSTKYRNLETPASQNYQLKVIEGTRGSWGNAFLWWVLGISGAYVALNLIRETLNYILFGKSFDWLWLIVLIALVSSSDEDEEEK